VPGKNINAWNKILALDNEILTKIYLDDMVDLILFELLYLDYIFSACHHFIFTSIDEDSLGAALYHSLIILTN